MNAIADTDRMAETRSGSGRSLGSAVPKAIALILLRISIHKSLKARKKHRLSGYARPYRVRG